MASYVLVLHRELFSSVTQWGLSCLETCLSSVEHGWPDRGAAPSQTVSARNLSRRNGIRSTVLSTHDCYLVGGSNCGVGVSEVGGFALHKGVAGGYPISAVCDGLIERITVTLGLTQSHSSPSTQTPGDTSVHPGQSKGSPLADTSAPGQRTRPPRGRSV
jgi:hypothetical protein